MINDFRGQVKVADVQAAFDEIVNNINGLIDSYNQATDYAGVDYTKGSPSLSAPSYTLSVGGLKTVLTNYNNTLIGCNIFKIDDLSCIVTEGLYITSDKVYRIPSQYVVGESGWDMSELYYDTVNEVLMFKDGTHGAIVTEQSVFNQPTINSNTEYGIFSASNDSQNAYKCTSSEGWTGVISSGQHIYEQGITGTHALTWELPTEVNCTEISYNLQEEIYLPSGFPDAYANVNLYLDGEKVYTQWGQNTITVSKKVNKIQLIANFHRIHGFKYKFSDLLVQGTSSSIAIEQGGVITPSDSIIKICDLNWRAKDGLIKDFNQLQLEKPIGYTLNNSNKGVLGNNHFMNNDTLNTNNSGKFVAYSMLFAEGDDDSESRGWHYGNIDILGKRIIDNHEDGNPEYRSSGTSFVMSTLYIPKGCTDNMSSYCWWGEGSSTGIGRTVTDPIFKYDP